MQALRGKWRGLVLGVVSLVRGTGGTWCHFVGCPVIYSQRRRLQPKLSHRNRCAAGIKALTVREGPWSGRGFESGQPEFLSERPEWHFKDFETPLSRLTWSSALRVGVEALDLGLFFSNGYFLGFKEGAARVGGHDPPLPKKKKGRKRGQT